MNGIESIAAERQRQIDKEGWTTEHDDRHTDGSIADAAACYANPMALSIDGFGLEINEPDEETEKLEAQVPLGWPASWSFHWWKPKSRRENLVRAGALIAAEIDRLDRINIPSNKYIAGRTLETWKELARQDDCLDHMVPSDLRELLAAIPS